MSGYQFSCLNNGHQGDTPCRQWLTGISQPRLQRLPHYLFTSSWDNSWFLCYFQAISTSNSSFSLASKPDLVLLSSNEAHCNSSNCSFCLFGASHRIGEEQMHLLFLLLPVLLAPFLCRFLLLGSWKNKDEIINHCGAPFILGSMKMYLHFLMFLKTQMAPWDGRWPHQGVSQRQDTFSPV